MKASLLKDQKTNTIIEIVYYQVQQDQAPFCIISSLKLYWWLFRVKNWIVRDYFTLTEMISFILLNSESFSIPVSCNTLCLVLNLDYETTEWQQTVDRLPSTDGGLVDLKSLKAMHFSMKQGCSSMHFRVVIFTFYW